VLHRGRTRTFAHVDSPVAVELRGHRMYVGVLAGFDETGNVTSPGKILRYRR
jgi:small nuclear ribonucleoprotein (snRNP)-like protein